MDVVDIVIVSGNCYRVHAQGALRHLLGWLTAAQLHVAQTGEGQLRSQG